MVWGGEGREEKRGHHHELTSFLLFPFVSTPTSHFARYLNEKKEEEAGKEGEEEEEEEEEEGGGGRGGGRGGDGLTAKHRHTESHITPERRMRKSGRRKGWGGSSVKRVDLKLCHSLSLPSPPSPPPSVTLSLSLSLSATSPPSMERLRLSWHLL